MLVYFPFKFEELFQCHQVSTYLIQEPTVL